MQCTVRTVLFSLILRDYAKIEAEVFAEGLAFLRSASASVDSVLHRAGVGSTDSPAESTGKIVDSLDAFEPGKKPAANAQGWWVTDWAHHDADNTFFVREGDFFAYRTGSGLWFAWRPIGPNEYYGRTGWGFFVAHHDGFKPGSTLAASCAANGFRYWTSNGGCTSWQRILGADAPDVPVRDFMGGTNGGAE